MEHPPRELVRDWEREEGLQKLPWRGSAGAWPRSVSRPVRSCRRSRGQAALRWLLRLGVVELIDDFDGDTYRAVYTAKIGSVLAVLHAFKKKSDEWHRDSAARDQVDPEPVPHRDAAPLRKGEGEPRQEVRHGGRRRGRVRRGKQWEPWAGLGEPDAAELHARSQLMMRVTDILRERKLTQVQMAELLGTTQPVVSDLVRGKLQGFRLSGYSRFWRHSGMTWRSSSTPGSR